MTLLPFGLSVRALLPNPRNELLFLKRSATSKYFANTWELPGGKVDPGEPFDAALIREVSEETGLMISPYRVIGATQYELPHIKLVALFLEAGLRSSNVLMSSEHQEYSWVPLDRILGLDLSPQMAQFLTEYVSSKSR